MSKKTIGWVLIAISIIIIVLVMFQTIKIFTGTANPPEIFKTQDISLSEGKNDTSADIQTQKIVAEQVNKIFPSNFSTKIFNLTSWVICASLIIFGAGKFGSLGIGLLKD